MRAKNDSGHGRQMITRRFTTVEPVFGNLRGSKHLNRFTLRGMKKTGQIYLFANITEMTA